MFRIKGTHLKKIRSINMFFYQNIQLHLFQKFSFQTIACSFPEFQAPAGKLSILIPADEFIGYQDISVSILKNSIYSDIKHTHEDNYFRISIFPNDPAILNLEKL